MTASLQAASSKQQVAKEPYELRERTAQFGEHVISWCRSLHTDHVSRPLVSQLVRSATSVGANYAEASNGSSRRDFRNKVFIAKKELQETSHWLRMLKSCFPTSIQMTRLQEEADELTKIMQSISNKVKDV